MTVLNHVDSIPSAQISTIQHYPKSILIKMKDGTLYVTKQFSIGVSSIVGDFEREPYSNLVDCSSTMKVAAVPHASTE